jgi:hypothetical protein
MPFLLGKTDIVTPLNWSFSALDIVNVDCTCAIAVHSLARALLSWQQMYLMAGGGCAQVSVAWLLPC